MEQQQKSKQIDEYLNATTGENEGSQSLEPKEITIVGVTIKTHNKDEEKMDNPLVEILCKHPDKDDPIKLTSIKRLQDDKVINSALFMSVDKEGKFFKDGAIAFLLRFLEVNTLKELEGKKCDTVKQSEKSKYMALRCY